ncbi:MAG: uracil-DNA glycosylase [Clostridia bacterium]|nr:uracil-DNA glycosylase [Clostridia bacterium]MBR5754065.1 uracil-DNA glycosylase [Clostridia bacterium]
MYETMEALQASCAGCTRCRLCEGRTNLVFGVGDPKADLLFVGEGPGYQEDVQGEPFVGPSGQLLDKLLAAIDLDRQNGVYIANIVKCRPPQNRDPQPDEQDICLTWLREQVRVLRPKIIVCLGRIAAQKLIDPEFRVTKEHGQFVERKGVWMMGTFHPAALLRNPAQKPDAFDDFLALRDKLQELGL